MCDHINTMIGRCRCYRRCVSNRFNNCRHDVLKHMASSAPLLQQIVLSFLDRSSKKIERLLNIVVNGDSVLYFEIALRARRGVLISN